MACELNTNTDRNQIIMNEEYTWTIVEFEDSSVEAIPTSLIQGDSCHWPTFSQQKIIIAIKKCELNTSWPLYKITVFRKSTFVIEVHDSRMTTNTVRRNVFRESPSVPTFDENKCNGLCSCCNSHKMLQSILTQSHHILRGMVADIMVEIRKIHVGSANNVHNLAEQGSIFTKFQPGLSFPIASNEKLEVFKTLMQIEDNFMNAVSM